MTIINECPACGSRMRDREDYIKRTCDPKDGVTTELAKCPFCGADKCCMCDMGDDVRCLSCESCESEEELEP